MHEKICKHVQRRQTGGLNLRSKYIRGGKKRFSKILKKFKSKLFSSFGPCALSFCSTFRKNGALQVLAAVTEQMRSKVNAYS